MKWFWTAWLLLIAASFGASEWYALTHESGLSLSQYTVDAFHAWPPLGILIGIGIGILICHFTWPWVPKQLRATCGACGKTILLERK